MHLVLGLAKTHLSVILSHPSRVVCDYERYMRTYSGMLLLDDVTARLK